MIFVTAFFLVPLHQIQIKSMSKAKKIAALKKYMKVQVNDEEREKEILDKLDCEDYKPYKEQMTAIYKEIFQQMKDLESGED